MDYEKILDDIITVHSYRLSIRVLEVIKEKIVEIAKINNSDSVSIDDVYYLIDGICEDLKKHIEGK